MSELYELPNGWRWCSIKSIVVDTKTKNPSDLDAQTFTYIDIGSVNNEIFQIEEPKTINVEDAPSRARKEIRLNDIVYSTTRPNLKNIAIVTKVYENPIASTGFCVLRVTDKSNNRYLFYYLLTKTYFEQIERKIRGAQYPAVSDSDVKNSQIPLPPLSEQQRIVEKLDKLFEKIDKAIALHQKNIDEADAFMGSALNEVFGELEEKYDTDLIGNVITVAQYGFSHKATEEGQYPFLRMGDLQNGKIRYDDLKYVDLSEADYTKYKLNKFDLLFNRTNSLELVGKTSIFEEDVDMFFASYLVRVRANEKIVLPYFLNYFLNSKNTQSKLKEMATKAVNQSNINAQKLKSISAPTPPLSVQQKVVTYLDDLSDKIERVKAVQKEKMDSLKALKASILDKAFRGEL